MPRASTGSRLELGWIQLALVTAGVVRATFGLPTSAAGANTAFTVLHEVK